MSDLDFSAHETDEFTEEDDCVDGVNCMTQPFETNEFVLIETVTESPMEYFVELNQEKESDGYNTRFLDERATCFNFVS